MITRYSRLAGKDVAEAHERDELAQLGRRVPQAHAAPVTARGELQAGQRVHRDRVDGDAAHVAQRLVGIGRREQPADALAQPGQVGPGDRDPRSRTRSGSARARPSGLRPPAVARLIGRRTMSSSADRGLHPRDRPKGSPDEQPRQPNPLARTPRPLPRRPDDRARRHDRGRRAAVDPRGPRLLRDVAGLGRERVPAHLRRLPASRRPARRPLRPPAPLPRRHRALHRRLARVRPRAVAGVPDRRPGGAGARRRGRLGGRALADDDALHRAGRAGEGDGRLRLRRRRRRQPRRAARRGPHRRAQLALDLPRQRPGRRASCSCSRSGSCRPAAGQGAARRLDVAGAVTVTASLHARRLRDRERQRGGLDLAADAGRARRGGRAARRLPRDRVAGRVAADAARPLPAAQRRRLERRRRALGGGDVRLVLPVGALPPARARLQPARRSASPSCPAT